MYEEVYELIKIILKHKEDEHNDKKRKDAQTKSLKKIYSTLKEQLEDGFDDQDDGEEVDYRKIYKTIMCPLKNKCGKVKL